MSDDTKALVERRDNQRYDVIYSSSQECYLEPHHCREWDESGGCYGFNSRHGFSKEEALAQQILYYVNVVTDLEMQLHKLRDGEHNELE